MTKHYAVVHYAGFEAPDDGSPEPDPIERRWTGHAADPELARQAWVAEHGHRDFTEGPVQPWTSDRFGMDDLLIFRVPASPFDLPGLFSLLMRRAPVAYVANQQTI